MHNIFADTIQAQLNTRKQGVYLPASQAYTLLDTSKNTSKYLLEATTHVEKLCDEFSNIHLKLKPGNTDVRPFLWNDFICLKRYTYTVALNNINKESIQSLPEFKKWQHLQVRQEVLRAEDIHQHINFLKPFVKKRRIKSIQIDLHENINDLNVLNIVDEQNLVYAQMIFNIHIPEAQQLFYFVSEESKKKRIGVFAQYAFMLFFKEKGYSTFDFCGANIPNIAEYKRSFPVKLEPIYELWFHRNPLKLLAHRYLFHQV